MLYLLIFIGGGLAGWAVDTAYRSVDEKRFASATFIPFFSPTYGFASAMLFWLFFFWPASWVAHVLVGALLCTLVELVTGVLSVRFLHRRFWDYRGNWLNYHGHIDLFHFACWLGLAACYRIIFELLI